LSVMMLVLAVCAWQGHIQPIDTLVTPWVTG
jgi:hypothetical protein